MDIDKYLRRVGYEGPTRPDIETLRALQYAHATTIAYETFDIFLGRRTTTDPAGAFDKIVGEGRGGWCYEHNGLLGWALERLGFKVTRMTADGDRPGTHLTLRVDVPGAGPFICDPGYSDAPLYPFALASGPFEQNGFVYGVETLEAGRFRFVNHRFGLAPGYVAGPVNEEAMADASVWLQTASESRFIHFPIVCIHSPSGAVKVLAGRIFRTLHPDRVESALVETADQYVQVLRETFNLTLPEAANLWPDIARQHDDYLRRKADAAAHSI